MTQLGFSFAPPTTCSHAASPCPERPAPTTSSTPRHTPVVYRAMTDDERTMACALYGCTFPVGSPPKRFARDVSAQAEGPDPHISERQAEWLRVLVYRYRRQIPIDVVALALIKEGRD